MRGWMLFAVLFLGFTVAGCTNKISGNVTVDGKALSFKSCRSGQVYGFAGVELKAASGERLRLVMTPSGHSVAVYFNASSTTGVTIGRCGPFELRRQNSTVNKVTNVAGKATLDCKTSVAIKGEVSFENCH
ncbi:MAG: hypothetical protein KC609_06390 [Myxococcales bacterium]|nr:hypothetical protein [Myxococcales bacterium]